jgi:hypothetical protein
MEEYIPEYAGVTGKTVEYDFGKSIVRIPDFHTIDNLFQFHFTFLVQHRLDDCGWREWRRGRYHEPL